MSPEGRKKVLGGGERRREGSKGKERRGKERRRVRN